ncbi:Translation elongation factor Ts [hydrothermal vent metagenome]|uniref:Translation elongation factor Ts n=1 Tax=hydrothermal vent metagenome TaxID=652676 RepID=A0A3B0RSI7_9ZZZZ
MAQITAAMVKELRDISGAGMMDCKTALKENDGDIQASIDWLRTKGLAKAAKKSSRVASEGLVGATSNGNSGTVVEVNSETDFVARNEIFQGMVNDIVKIAASVSGDYDKLKAAEFPGAGKSVEDHVTEMVGTIGENMSVRRSATLSVGEGVVASYIHNSVAPGLGKIAVLVALETTGDGDAAKAFGQQVAMHIAAINPLALTEKDVAADVVERERTVYTEQARESGKPDNIIEKMVDGRMRKFFQESVLLSQTFVVDGENTVAKAAELAASDVGAPVTIAGFVRYELGDGIEKKVEDFAAEVAATAAGN